MITKYSILKDKVLNTNNNECWLWEFANNGNGYGILWFGEDLRYVHSLSWELINGPIPDDGLEFDHTCKNRSCYNYKHLERVTHKINSERRTSTHCYYGHKFDEENTYNYKGKRYCRKCRQYNMQNYKNKQ